MHVAVPAELGSAQGINSYSDRGSALKRAFHAKGKRLLKALAESLGLQPGEYDIRNNLAGIAVSGEVTLHADHLYVWLAESCMSPGIEVTYRACASRKDYCGDRNYSIALADFANPETQSLVRDTMAKLIEHKRAQLIASGNLQVA